MTVSPWQRRIQRAQELARRHSFAGEILAFYIHVAGFQENLYGRLSAALPQSSASMNDALDNGELSEIGANFKSFLSLAEAHGPKPLAKLSREFCARGQDFWSDVLNNAWTKRSASDAQGLLALTFLQPYAELLRSRSSLRPRRYSSALCPFCNRRPGFAVLRQKGEGAARSLVCFFCVTEWEFRRLVCPACAEENDKQLPIFTAGDFDYIRVECCDSCKTYIKSIDLTKNGHAQPFVDELASAPLDLWAHDRGYAKLQSNILGM
jgi:FdhE protein